MVTKKKSLDGQSISKGSKAAGVIKAVKDGHGCFYSFKQNKSRYKV
jgi:hypothetical protein